MIRWVNGSSSPGSILIRWARTGASEAVLALGAPNPDLPALRRVHGVRVSHRGSGDLRQDPAFAHLVDVLCAAVEARTDGWPELLTSAA